MQFLIFLQQGAGSSLPTLIMMGAIFIVFYFFMIRPQQKKQKDAKSFRDNIKRGDEIVTIGGLHGKVASVESDDTVVIEVAPTVRLKFEKSAISMESSKKAQTGESK